MLREELRFPISFSLDHRVIFSEDVFAENNTLLLELLLEGRSARRVRFLCLIDEGLHEANPALEKSVVSYGELHSKNLELVAGPKVFPGGERIKQSPELFESLLKTLFEAKLCRHSFVVVIGGGAFLDAACFASSLVHRGIRQIRIPTTVLAQNDAGIGIKNGIDYRGKKNFLGTFYVPHVVVNDFSLLKTLDAPHWRDGMAEAVKVALIRDPEFFFWIEANAMSLSRGYSEGPMSLLIRRCAELHLRHISAGGDPLERGSARPLDFGHWSAHCLEQLSRFELTHGQAVAIGIVIDSLYSWQAGHLSREEAGRIRSCIESLGFQVDVARRFHLDSDAGIQMVLQGLLDFQEHLGGELSITLLQGIGQPFEIHQFDEKLLFECVSSVLRGSAQGLQ